MAKCLPSAKEEVPRPGSPRGAHAAAEPAEPPNLLRCALGGGRESMCPDLVLSCGQEQGEEVELRGISLRKKVRWAAWEEPLL